MNNEVYVSPYMHACPFFLITPQRIEEGMNPKEYEQN
jgi:hypothetical protein